MTIVILERNEIQIAPATFADRRQIAFTIIRQASMQLQLVNIALRIVATSVAFL